MYSWNMTKKPAEIMWAYGERAILLESYRLYLLEPVAVSSNERFTFIMAIFTPWLVHFLFILKKTDSLGSFLTF